LKPSRLIGYRISPIGYHLSALGYHLLLQLELWYALPLWQTNWTEAWKMPSASDDLRPPDERDIDV